jgi:hypothetical protein
MKYRVSSAPAHSDANAGAGRRTPAAASDDAEVRFVNIGCSENDDVRLLASLDAGEHVARRVDLHGIAETGGTLEFGRQRLEHRKRAIRSEDSQQGTSGCVCVCVAAPQEA